MIEQLRQKAGELLEKKEVSLIIGYGQGSSARDTFPVFISRPEDAERLIFTPFCTNNLALYCVKKEVASRGKIGLVARPEEIRSISVLVQEEQLAPHDVALIGVYCEEAGNENAECGLLSGSSLKALEKEIASRFKGRDLSDETIAKVRELEALSPKERWVFWEKEFSRCIKCYACRQACPLCYCTQCIVEKNQLQWIPTSPHSYGNYSWNMIRAFPLAGRCISCGAWPVQFSWDTGFLWFGVRLYLPSGPV